MKLLLDPWMVGAIALVGAIAFLGFSRGVAIAQLPLFIIAFVFEFFCITWSRYKWESCILLGLFGLLIAQWGGVL